MLTFTKTTDIPGELTEYEVREQGRYLGTLYREWQTMSEWGLDTGLENRFGENAAAGHHRLKAVIQEITRLATEDPPLPPDQQKIQAICPDPDCRQERMLEAYELRKNEREAPLVYTGRGAGGTRCIPCQDHRHFVFTADWQQRLTSRLPQNPTLRK